MFIIPQESIMVWKLREIKNRFTFTHRIENKNDKVSWRHFNNSKIYVSEKLYNFIINPDIDVFYYPETWGYLRQEDDYYNLAYYDFIITDDLPDQTFILGTDDKKLYSKIKLLF